MHARLYSAALAAIALLPGLVKSQQANSMAANSAAAILRRTQDHERRSYDADRGRLGRSLQPVFELPEDERDAAGDSEETGDVGGSVSAGRRQALQLYEGVGDTDQSIGGLLLGTE